VSTAITFRPGDEVIILTGYPYDRRHELDVVAKVTPSGQVVTKTGRRFNPDGGEKRSADSYQPRAQIIAATDTLRAKARRDILVDYLGSALPRWKGFPTEKLEAIAAACGMDDGNPTEPAP
jgi:hypothetical protein